MPENQFSFSKIQQINETLICSIHTVTSKDKFVTLGKDCVSCYWSVKHCQLLAWHAHGSISSHCRSVGMVSLSHHHRVNTVLVCIQTLISYLTV